MDYKKYYKEIKDRLKEFSDVVYYEPMSNNEILDIEKRIDKIIKPLYREYLSTFGMNQDIFDELITRVESFLEDCDFIKDSLKDYLPISIEVDVEDTIYLINNKDLQDDFVYEVIIDNKNNIGKIKKTKLFHQIIEESIANLENNHNDRCLNTNKVNNTEFTISGNDYPDFVDIFKTEGLKQIMDWKPKYYPENIFGDEVALFELFNERIIIQRDENNSQYRFELEEPIIIEKEKSIILKTEQLLNANRIKFKKIECKLLEND